MYSCSGFSNNFSEFDTSHNFPFLSTPILSHICLTTGRSWLINKIVKFSCSWRSFNKFNIWACILTSNAEVGSSHTNSLGCVARALATQPRLLVCDEPTSALDVSIQAQILNLLKDLQEQLNLTILFISHDLPVVRQMCDRIGVLRNGKLCEVSNSEKLFEKPEHEYTKELLNLMPKIEAIYN